MPAVALDTVASSAHIERSSERTAARIRFWDGFEKVALLTFFCYFLIPVFEAVREYGDLSAALIAGAESMVVGFVLFRKPARTFSTSPGDWLLGFGATAAPMLARPVIGGSYWAANIGLALMFCGIGFQVYAKYFLGRRFGVVAANRGVCAEGPYHLVRHPIYLGYLATHVGFLCASFSWWNVGVYAATYALMIPRIFAEERLLRRDPAYAAYMDVVRSRLIPGVL
ncbi:MAG: methyltransferase [Pirellulales bacterium]